MGGGQKRFYKQSSTKQALCFDYAALMEAYNINLNIEIGADNEEYTGGKPTCQRKRVISSNCVNVIVFWKPRPVKVGAFLCVFFFAPYGGENRFYTFYNFYIALNQRINIENDRSTTFYICLQNAVFSSILLQTVYNAEAFLFSIFTRQKHRTLIFSGLKFCRKCRKCRSQNRVL